MIHSRTHIFSAIALTVLVGIVAVEARAQYRPTEVPRTRVPVTPPVGTGIGTSTMNTNLRTTTPIGSVNTAPSSVRISPGAAAEVGSTGTAASSTAGSGPTPPEEKSEDGGGDDSPTPTPTPAESPQANSNTRYDSSDSATPLAAVSPLATATTQDSSSFPWFWLGGGVVALMVIVGVVRSRRRY